MRKLAVAVASLTVLGNSWAQVTERVSVASGGAEANGGGDLPTPPGGVVSADGRYVAFISGASNLVPGDTNGGWDVFVRDRQSGTTERVNVDSHGGQSNGFSGLFGVAISSDGRYVAFESQASNLVPGDTNGARDIFLRDLVSGTTERVSIGSIGAQGNAGSIHPSISPDGRFVAFESDATNLVSVDTNGHIDVFVRDRLTGTTELISISSNSAQGNGTSQIPSISADGRYVAFASEATNLVPGDTNGRIDVFVRDRQGGTTERVSIQTGFAQGNGNSNWPSISMNGRYVSFTSDATNLVGGDTNGRDDVFLRDRRDDTTERVSVAAGGAQGDGHSSEAWMSADARLVVFRSTSTNFAPGTVSNHYSVFVRDRLLGTTDIVSLTTGGLPPDNSCGEASISADGRYVVFRSNATNLVPGDTNGNFDVFLHDRDASGFTSLCDAGTAGVISCPCSNPPAGSSRGCDNSSATGGASLSASGLAYLSIDSLILTTSGQTPAAASILLQSSTPAVSGIGFGQGVRCAGGTIKRLYTKTASGGSIIAPDFGAGEPAISARSAATGDLIQAGQCRWYLVYYRDSIVLGACSPTSTFNATQTGRVSWWP